MPLLTNELLERLEGSITRLNDAVSNAETLGIPISPNVPFFRMGEPVRIPVAPDSGATPFPATGMLQMPPNVTTFRMTNNNPFGIRLRGTRSGQSFISVTSTTGWLFMPGEIGVYTSVYPVQLAAMSVDGPFAATDPSQKAGVGFLELQYGTGV